MSVFCTEHAHEHGPTCIFMDFYAYTSLQSKYSIRYVTDIRLSRQPDAVWCCYIHGPFLQPSSVIVAGASSGGLRSTRRMKLNHGEARRSRRRTCRWGSMCIVRRICLLPRLPCCCSPRASRS
ncbi:hypothetical protein CGRA01v4_01194 [Colletotrichum graminicola]|nr:hypothetical protein CGRA01v4_01194 [Colletotrichum graminicola]